MTNRRNRTVRLVCGMAPLCAAAVATAQSTPSFNLQMLVRETETSAAIFTNGGGANGPTPGDGVAVLRGITTEVQPLVADGQWHQFTFTFNTGMTPDGRLSGSGNLKGAKGAFDGITVQNTSGTIYPIKMYFDDFHHVDGSAPSTPYDLGFEVGADGVTPITPIPTVSGTYLFRQPSFSGSSSINPSGPNTSQVVSEEAHSGANSLRSNWQFNDALTNRTLRLTSNNTPNFGNLALSFANGSSLSFWAKAVVDFTPLGWKTNNAGDWFNDANWSEGAAPNGNNATARFLTAIGVVNTAVTVTLNQNVDLNTIQFDNAKGYTVSGTGQISTHGNVSFRSTITTITGNHTINVPIAMGALAPADATTTGLILDTAANTTLTLNGDITNALPDDTFPTIQKTSAGTANIKNVTGSVLLASQGTLNVGSGATAAFLTGEGDVTASAGATLNFNGAALSAGDALGGAGTVNLNSGATVASRLTGTGTVKVAAGATLQLTGESINLVPPPDPNPDNLPPLRTSSGGTLNVDGSVTVAASPSAQRPVMVAALTIGAAGKVDLTDNELLINYAGTVDAPKAALLAALQAAYAKGAWTGASGLTSSTAAANANHILGIGWADATEVGSPATFAGMGIDATTLIVKLTYNGDTDLDGDVDAADFARMTPGPGSWATGDNNYDGVVSSDDFARAALAYAMQGAPFTSASAVPEPAAIGLLGLAGAALVGRRRR